MSGHKRTTVSLSEFDLNRLRNMEDHLHCVESDYEKIRNRILDAQEETINYLTNYISQQDHLLLNQVGQEIGFRSSKQISELQEIINELGLIINQKIEDVFEKEVEFQENISTQIKDHIERLDNQITEYLDEKLFFIENDLHSSINQIREAQLQKEKKVQELFNRALELLDFFYHNFSMIDHFSVDLNENEIEMTKARENIQNGFLEAGWILVQSVIHNLEELHNKMLTYEVKYKTIRNLCNYKVEELERIAINNSKIKAIGINNDELGIDLDVMYWSNGKYRGILRQIDYLRKLMNNPDLSYNLEFLEDILLNIVPKIKKGLFSTFYVARRNALASQLRFNIASKVIQALSEQGFLLAEGKYEESDQRKDYEVLLRHPDGSQVIVNVRKLGDDLGSSILELESLDATIKTEHELRQRAKEVALSLRRYGLKVGKNKNAQPLSSAKKEAEHSYPTIQNSPNKLVREEGYLYGRN